MDFYLTEAGDIAVSGAGDIAMTQNQFRDDLQQAYIRMLTDQGDWLLFPDLGANLSQLIGLPQSPETGRIGENIIINALEREGTFTGKAFTVTGVPTGPSSIRFDIRITSGSRGEQTTLSVEQEL